MDIEPLAKLNSSKRSLRLAETSLAQRVCSQLRSEIIYGILPPGERLVELEIAERMGTSQAPVREALQRLERDGLVERRARSATYVSAPVMAEIYELFAIRSLVEGFAALHAARNISPVQCDELHELVEQMRRAARNDDTIVLVDADMDFHQRICEWSAMPTLLRVWMPLYAPIQRFIAQTRKQYFPDLVEVADTHLPIVATLRQGNGEEARRVMQEHVMLIWSRIKPQK